MKIFNRTIPNCSKCEWKFGTMTFPDNPIMYCIAQGSQNCISVYGNKNCRNLYEEKKAVGLYCQMVGRIKRPKKIK